MSKKNENNRIENLLVMLLLSSLKGASNKEKALKLHLAGLSNIEIANFLTTTPQVIANTLSEERKAKKKRMKKNA